MWNDEVTLLKRTFERDDLGQQIPGENVETTVLCNKKSVGQREHYSAMQLGLQLDIIIVIKNYEYDDQDRLIFNGKEYHIERTYSDSFEEIELMCRLLSKNG